MSYRTYLSNIEKGFPLTHYPRTIPKVQNKIVSRRTLAFHENQPKIRASLGTEGVQHAHGDSLTFIQDYLNWFFEGDLECIIPKNALTVSYAMTNFVPGKSCQEFYPKDREMPADAFFTYQMLSKHCQATFYNEGGVAFLAGICYYLQLKKSLLITTAIDEFVMSEINVSNIPYPLGDRWKTRRFINFKYYGRDCKTAGKRVQVYLADGKDPVHQDFNFRTMKYEFTSCAECREEAKTYKFVPVAEKVEEQAAVRLKDDDKEEKPQVELKEEVTLDEPTIKEKLQQLQVKEHDDGLLSDDSDYDLAEDLYD